MAPTPEPVSVEAQLAVINTKLDLLTLAVTESRTDHERRIRSLEQFKWGFFGAGVLVSAATGVVTQLLF